MTSSNKLIRRYPSNGETLILFSNNGFIDLHRGLPTISNAGYSIIQIFDDDVPLDFSHNFHISDKDVLADSQI